MRKYSLPKPVRAGKSVVIGGELSCYRWAPAGFPWECRREAQGVCIFLNRMPSF